MPTIVLALIGFMVAVVGIGMMIAIVVFFIMGIVTRRRKKSGRDSFD